MTKRRASPTSLDEDHTQRVTEWEDVQTRYKDAMDVSFSGMISQVDAAKSLKAHKEYLKEKGYKFGMYHTDRSLFEKLDRLVFQDTPNVFMGREIFDQVRGMLKEINEGSRPKKNRFSLLVMMSTKYVTPVADLVHLLVHPNATLKDLELVWELTDRIWCFAHPILDVHSGYLDATCVKITQRLDQLRHLSG